MKFSPVYTPLDYVISIIILLLIVWFFWRYFFNRFAFDKKFLKAISPFILFGILVRLLADNLVGIFPRTQLWSVTPGVYILAVGTATLCIIIGVLFQRRLKSYWQFPFSVGLLLDLVLIYLLLGKFLGPGAHPWRIIFPLVLAFTFTSFYFRIQYWLLLPLFGLATSSVIIYSLSINQQVFRPFIWSISFLVFGIILIFTSLSPGVFPWANSLKIFQRKENFFIIFAHLLDGSATFLAIDFFGFGEEHPLPAFLFSTFDSAVVLLPLKLTLILLILWFIEKSRQREKENSEKEKSPEKQEIFYRILKLTLFIIGFGPGIRNTILPALI